ncbi:hypothetical protein [Pseudomonas sp. COR18]|uniref:hypothetical protein n=1 Tax=Pseudomonas sp. COR18 TaxID=3399680 RepID=UPI003AFF7991
MSEERFRIWITFWQFVLGAVVVGIFSTVISHQIQKREVEIKEQESSAKLLEQALQEDIGVRRRLSQYFASVTRSPELRERWGEYSKIVEAEYEETKVEKKKLQEQVRNSNLSTLERDNLLQRIGELEQQLSPKPGIRKAPTQARVYIHISSEAQRSAAEQTAVALRSDAVAVPGVELRANTPRKTEIRYFMLSERAEAEGLASAIRMNWPDTIIQYVAGFENSTAIRPRHYELWISANAKSQLSRSD